MRSWDWYAAHVVIVAALGAFFALVMHRLPELVARFAS